MTSVVGQAFFPVTQKNGGESVFAGIIKFVVSLEAPLGVKFIRIGRLLWTTANIFDDPNTVAGLLSAMNTAMGAWPRGNPCCISYPVVYTYLVGENEQVITDIPIHGASLGLAATVAALGYAPVSFVFTGFEQSFATDERCRGDLTICPIDELRVKARGVASLKKKLVCGVQEEAPAGVIQCRHLKDVILILQEAGVKKFPFNVEISKI